MSEPSDTGGVLHRFVTDESVERLLAGDAEVDEGLARAAGLVASLRQAGRADEFSGTEALLAEMTQAVREGGTPSTSRRRPVLARVTGKVAVLATAAVLSAGAAAAAATGSLPDPIQRGVSDTFAHVGIGLPHPHAGSDEADSESGDSTATTLKSTKSSDSDESSEASDATTTKGTRSSDSTTPTTLSEQSHASTPVGPDASGPAMHGLCTAYLANDHTKNPDAVAFRNLIEAAGKAGKTVQEYCASTTSSSESSSSSSSSGDSSTSTDNHGNSGNTPGATAPGQVKKDSSTTASTETHGSSGSTPGATAPGHEKSTSTTLSGS